MLLPFLQREIFCVNLLDTRRFTHVAQATGNQISSLAFHSTDYGTTLFSYSCEIPKITQSEANRKMHFALYQHWFFI